MAKVDLRPSVPKRLALSQHLVAEGDVYPIAPFPADEDHHDIVWADWAMARRPDDSGLALFSDGFESAELWGYWSCSPGF